MAVPATVAAATAVAGDGSGSDGSGSSGMPATGCALADVRAQSPARIAITTVGLAENNFMVALGSSANPTYTYEFTDEGTVMFPYDRVYTFSCTVRARATSVLAAARGPSSA